MHLVWKNTVEGNADRIYIYDIPVEKNTILWLERFGQSDYQLKYKGGLGGYDPEDILDLVDDYLFDNDIDASWEALVAFVSGGANQNPSNLGDQDALRDQGALRMGIMSLPGVWIRIK